LAWAAFLAAGVLVAALAPLAGARLKDVPLRAARFGALRAPRRDAVERAGRLAFFDAGREVATRFFADRALEAAFFFAPDLAAWRAGARRFEEGLAARARAARPLAADRAGVMRPPRGAPVNLAQRGEAP
jgi:hypothetical protein